MHAKGSQLGQSRPSNTSTATLFTGVLPVTEVTGVWITNSTGSAADASLFHDDDGTTYDADTALLYTKSIPANDSLYLNFEPGSGLQVSTGGSIGIQSGTSNALTFTLYGITSQLANT